MDEIVTVLNSVTIETLFAANFPNVSKRTAYAYNENVNDALILQNKICSIPRS